MSEHTKPADPGQENGGAEDQQIVDFGSALTRTPHGSVYCMTIIGQIEGHMTASSGTKTTKYEHVLPLLAKLEESDEVDGVLFLLNTVGGDIEAGLAIAELIACLLYTSCADSASSRKYGKCPGRFSPCGRFTGFPGRNSRHARAACPGGAFAAGGGCMGGRCGDFGRGQRMEACLLYTSRCV